MKASEKLFYKYQYLAKKYSDKLWNYQNISFEYEDVVQEFNIKILLAIKAYGRRWSYFLKTGLNKPVPLKNYLECACCNKLKDLMKLITNYSNKISIDEINYDFGMESETYIDTSKSVFLLNGVDLLENLIGEERIIFSLFLKGYKKNEITKLYKQKDTMKIIEQQKKFLVSQHREELIINNKIFRKYEINN